MAESKLKVQISAEDLLCKAGCGFYGNPQWDGLCSKCFRDDQLREKKMQDYVKNKSVLGGSFEKFEEKRRQRADRRSATLKSVFSKSPSNDSLSASATLPTAAKASGREARRKLSAESQAQLESFLSFLQDLPRPAAHEVSRQVQFAIAKIQQHAHFPPDDISEMVQELYQHVGERIDRVLKSKDCKTTVEEVLQQMEQFICVRTYKCLFCPKTDEEVADLSLQDRIRSLHWVTAGFLDTALDFSLEAVRDELDSAITEVIDVNSQRSPSDKLSRLVSCCKHIFAALQTSRGGVPASADEFLPVLIYVVLKSNPPQLQSNVKFVSRYALPTRLMSGEAGYYFTNLCCALQFIQNMNADSLKMPKDDFEAYTSGRIATPLNDANCACRQAIKSMETSLSQLRAVAERRERLSGQIDDLACWSTGKTEKLLDDIRTLRLEHPLDLDDSFLKPAKSTDNCPHIAQ